jgi:hypothetical protein
MSFWEDLKKSTKSYENGKIIFLNSERLMRKAVVTLREDLVTLREDLGWFLELLFTVYKMDLRTQYAQFCYDFGMGRI